MTKLLAGEKGKGKTKILIETANKTAQNSDGIVVYIDDDNRHMYDLNRDIRFVCTEQFPLSNYRELVGFICGVLSQNGDIKEIFIDGLSNIVKNFDNESLVKLITKLDNLSANNSVDFTCSYNAVVESLPNEAKEILI